MTTTVQAETPVGSSTPTGPLTRVVAASMATGLLGALLLTLVVFAGAGESTILGASLLSFGIGWALLATLSARRTNRPQSWAFVPAAVMSATGAALLVLSPGDTVLSRLGWIWPPVILALAVWSQRRARRQLPRPTRAWLVYPVLGFLTLAALGGGYETIRAATDGPLPAPPGSMVDVGGRSLHLHCTGSGAPVVVLSSGLGEHSTSWGWITRSVSRTTTVCAYDRAGQAWSDDASSTPDGAHIATDLHALLKQAHVPGPYVLAGHSTGGLYAQVFAARYPSDVTGVVLLDSLTPRAMTALPTYPRFYATARRGYGLLPSLARMGVGQVGFAGAGSDLPAEDGRAEHAIATTVRDLRSQHAELAALRATFAQAAELRSLGSTPLAVVTAGKGMQAGWPAEQDRMSALSTNSVHVTAPATHEDVIVTQSASAASARAIVAVVDAVRSHGRVTLPRD